MKEITVDGHAKVNLALDVVGKYANGYHKVCMVMQQIGLKDRITVRRTGGSRREINITTNSASIPTDGKNLAYKAAQLMLEMNETVERVDIHIEKNIPVEAGLAGGSTDCAAVLKAMNELFEMHLNTGQLCELGAGLGSDVPFCVLGGTAMASGTGTELAAVKGFNPERYMVLLCKPPIGVSTAEVYRRYSERMEEMNRVRHPNIMFMLANIGMGRRVEELAPDMINMLEYVTAEEHPVIKYIENIMIENGALHAMMTGSGPTVFGIFENKERAVDAYMRLRREFDETFITMFT